LDTYWIRVGWRKKRGGNGFPAVHHYDCFHRYRCDKRNCGHGWDYRSLGNGEKFQSCRIPQVNKLLLLIFHLQNWNSFLWYIDNLICSFDPDPRTRYTVWSAVIGEYFTYLTLYGATQANIQRFVSISTISKVRRALLYNLIGLLVLYGFSAFAGIVIFAKYSKCDPVTTGVRTSKIGNLKLIKFVSVFNMLKFNVFCSK